MSILQVIDYLLQDKYNTDIRKNQDVSGKERSMNNLEIRQAILKTGAKQWRIAEKLGISESSFSKLLRKELSEEKKNEILDTIESE